jgi:hypothetical protein
MAPIDLMKVQKDISLSDKDIAIFIYNINSDYIVISDWKNYFSVKFCQNYQAKEVYRDILLFILEYKAINMF